ncbi:MAG: reverse transcriptase domain-containing protein [Rhodothermales bacterium]
MVNEVRPNGFLEPRLNAFERLTTWDNLLLAYRKAAKGKRGHPNVARFEYRLEDNILLLQEELRTQTYLPGDYTHFHIHEPKRRLISAAPFRDRVVHHALCQVIEPAFERSFIFDSYANRKGKGTHRARQRAQAFARKYKYFIHLDIVQFFPSIDHKTLRYALWRKVKDEHVRRLINQILLSGEGVHGESSGRSCGLPIGNLTSQFWANVHLNPLDHFIKRSLGCKAYLRYVDDLVLFSNDKQQLHAWHDRVLRRVEDLSLSLHEPRHPQPVTEGLPFLGFVIYPDRVRLKRRKGIHYSRKLKQLLMAGDEEVLQASIQGWTNHVRYGNTVGLRVALLKQWTPND